MTAPTAIERIVYFFCDDPAKDPAAHHVWDALVRRFDPQPAGFDFDGRPVLIVHGSGSAEIHLARTRGGLSHDYLRFLPEMVTRFGDFDFAGLVNWHAGANAPDRVLTVHSTGDPPSGVFGRADAQRMRRLLLALERHRLELALESFSVVLEGTHWSGVPYGGDPRSIPDFDVPLIDVEIGSSPTAWADCVAAQVMARALVEASGPMTGPTPKSLLCVGGIHVEPAFRVAVFGSEAARPLAVSHILPNQWLVGYDTDEGLVRLRDCVASIDGGIDAIVFHDNLRGSVKARLRELGEALSVPTLKHQRLRAGGARLPGAPGRRARMKLTLSVLCSDDAHHRYLQWVLGADFDVRLVVTEPAAAQRRRALARRRFVEYAAKVYHGWRRKLLGLDRYRRRYFALPSGARLPAWRRETVESINDAWVAELLRAASAQVVIVMGTSILSPCRCQAASL